MNDTIAGGLVFLAGAALGVLFFGGLWWTVNRALGSDRPAQWFLVSLLVRMGIVLAGFYYVAGRHPARLLLMLAGFVIARVAITRLTRPPAGKGAPPAKEVHDAP